ncbi:MAG: hypothetical protein HUU15_01555 [Candidatus Brocadiae bacterium]|nr:hypothetical protein [Candidatus Brocadiia bacterium]
MEWLASPEAAAAMDLDPYWPKWTSPWWRMTTLWELGLASLIPEAAARKLADAINRHYLHRFPIPPETLPDGCDPYRNVMCHCALGTAFQVLSACGIDPDINLPWAREWFLKYQLGDGGLNCDERAYAKVPGKSSVVSTLPPLEAVLRCTNRAFTPEEERFLDGGARYLIDHRLYRSIRTGGVIHEDWLELCFPRFYHYDLLRGLSFLAEWSARRGKPIPRRVIEEPLGLLRAKMKEWKLSTERVACAGGTTLQQGGDGRWVGGVEADTFELLDRVSAPGAPNLQLTGEWKRVREHLGRGW